MRSWRRACPPLGATRPPRSSDPPRDQSDLLVTRALAGTGIALNLIDHAARRSSHRPGTSADGRPDRTAYDSTGRSADSRARRLLPGRAGSGEKAQSDNENKLPHMCFLHARPGGPENQLPSHD